MSSLQAARRAFAEELRSVAPVLHHPEILDVFAKVPREKFLGPGPWRLHTDCSSYRTPDADPRWLYHNVLASLNTRKKINNGSPALWAFHLGHLSIKEGERVLQLGAGTGYYTAIMATLVGPRGRVFATEIEKPLAMRAQANLKLWPQAEIVHADGSQFDAGEVDVITVFAGCTHPAPLWLARLAPGGRLLMPLVGDDKWGFMLKVVRQRNGFKASATGFCSFILAKGLRNRVEARSLARAIKSLNGTLPKLDRLHGGRPTPRQRRKAFFVGHDFWLSRR